MEIARERTRELPEDSDRKAELAETLSQFASVCRGLGRIAEAESYEREASALRQKTGANPAEADGAAGRPASDLIAVDPADRTSDSLATRERLDQISLPSIRTPWLRSLLRSAVVSLG